MTAAVQTRSTQVTLMHSQRTIIRQSVAGRRQKLSALVFAGGLLAALAGCSSTHEKLDLFTTSGIVADDYTITHAIVPQEQTVAIEIPVSAYARTLTDGEKGNIAFFAQKFQASGAALVGIAVPSGSPNQASAGRIATQVQAELAKNGIARSLVRRGAYRADGDDAIAPVRLAYRAVVAATDPCGSWPDLVTSTEQNRHFHNYGCATQQNLAAEVENPLDLQYPRGTQPPDAMRRADALQKYRQGQKINGDYSGETGGNIATGVGQ